MLGKMIRAERETRRWSQVELGRRSGLTQGHINQIESGKRRQPSEETVQAIAAAFGMTLEELYRRAYATPEALEQLRAQGVPPDVLAKLEELAPGLSPAQWDLLIAVAADMAGREPERRPKRSQRAVPPAEPHQPADRGDPPPSGSDRISARGWVRRLEV